MARKHRNRGGERAVDVLRRTSGKLAPEVRDKSTAARNFSAHAARKAAFQLETSHTGRPSRKSTRRGKNRQKAASNLTRQHKRQLRSPSARAARSIARRRQ